MMILKLVPLGGDPLFLKHVREPAILSLISAWHIYGDCTKIIF